MNSSNEFQMVGKEGILTKSVVTCKKFNLDNVDWQYQNNFSLSLMRDEPSSKLKIKNHLCEMNANTIKKITEIIYKEKVYTIEDTYSLKVPNVQPQPSQPEQLPREPKDAVSTNDSDKNDKQKSDGKKVYIFKKLRKRGTNREGEDDSLRNTKNISKNFCKAFISFLKSQRVRLDRRQVREAIKAYNALLEHKKYNNNLIRRIIGHESLRDIFKLFLQEEARNWICQSRVNDKTLHYEAIDVYLALFATLPLHHALSASSHSSNSHSEQDQEHEDE